jgi:hypothetical protein
MRGAIEKTCIKDNFWSRDLFYYQICLHAGYALSQQLLDLRPTGYALSQQLTLELFLEKYYGRRDMTKHGL